MNALWIADEIRKGEASQWSAYLNTFPTIEDYSFYHPAFAREAGHMVLKECADMAGLGIEEAVESGKCAAAWEPTGDASAYWDAWYGWVGECHAKYLEDFKDPTNVFSVPDSEPGRELVIDRPITFDEMKYAYVATMTRDFSGVGNIPLLDMPNTEESYNSHQYWYNKEQDTFCLMTERDVEQGDEVTVNYSHASKDAFIMFAQYGFAFKQEHHAEAEEKLCKDLTPGSKVY